MTGVSPVTVSTTLPGGIVLNRIYDGNSTVPVDVQCGSISYISSLTNQIKNQISYYNSSDGTNKFFDKIILNVYSPLVDFPSSKDLADTTPTGTSSDPGTSTINIQKYATGNPTPDYRFEGALSHEMGHAYHNWTRCFDSNRPYGAYFSAWWERQVSTNHTEYSDTGYPWYNPPRANENQYEQFANAFRYFFGCDSTRGQSGTSTDPVQPGFEDPAAHPDWGTQMKLLPETTAYWDTYGLLNGSLSWQPGQYWQFQNASGTWMAQTNYDTWYQWDGSNWNQVYPVYNRF